MQIHEQGLAGRREGTLGAARARADAAARAYGHGAAFGREVDPVGIDQLARMAQLAAQADGEQLALGEEGAAAALDGTGHAEEACAVGQFSHLRDDAARAGEGIVHMPQRAAAALAGKVKGGGALVLGDVAGLVHPHKVEGHAARAAALQGAQAVADRFKADLEALLQGLDVIAALARMAQKLAIGHQQGAGEIVGQALARERARLLIGQAAALDLLIHQLAVGQQGQLGRDLEGLLGVGQVGRDAQLTPACIVVAQLGGVGPLRRKRFAHDFDPVDSLHQLAQGRHALAGLQLPLLGQRLGGVVEQLEVVVAAVKEVARCLMRQGRQMRVVLVAIKARDQLPVFLVQAQMLLVERDHDAGHGGHLLHHALDVGRRHVGLADRAIAKQGAQLRQQALVLLLREVRQVEVEHLAQLEQHRGRDRALVVLELADIAE